MFQTLKVCALKIGQVICDGPPIPTPDEARQADPLVTAGTRLIKASLDDLFSLAFAITIDIKRQFKYCGRASQYLERIGGGMLTGRNTIILGLFATLVFLVGIGTAAAGGHQLSADLSWDNLVPPASGTSATGSALFTFNQGQGEVCFDITTSGLSGAVLADHIHEAPAGVNGGVVLSLGGLLSGCVAATPTLIDAILQNPESYYLNLHTALNPAGEIRGQLMPFVSVGGTTSFLPGGSGSSSGSIALFTGVAGVVAIAAGGWYARRRWLGSRS